MSLELPGYVVTAFNLVGLPWPGIDEDVLRSWANDVRRFAAQVHDTSARSHRAVAALAAEDSSPPARALLQRWDHYHGVISELRGPMDGFAGALDVAADAVVAQKGVVIGAAVGLAAAVVATQGEALFTFGLAEAEVPAEVAAARLVVKAALQELEGVLLGTLIGAAANEIAARLGGGIAKLVTGGGEVAGGAVSAKATYDAAKTAKLAMTLKGHQSEVGTAGSTSLQRSSSRQLATGGPGGGWTEVAKQVAAAVLRVLVQLFKDLVHAIGQIIDDTTALLKKMVGQLKHMDDERPPEAGPLTGGSKRGNEGEPGADPTKEGPAGNRMPIHVEGEPGESKLIPALENPEIKSEIDRAWNDSQAGSYESRHEEGGWLISNDAGDVRLARVPAGERAGISPPPPELGPGEHVEAFVHTHPNPPVDERSRLWEQGPSPADKRATEILQIPCVVRSAGDLYVYFPKKA